MTTGTRAAANSISFGCLRLARVLGGFNADLALVEFRHAVFTTEVSLASTARHECHSDSIFFFAACALLRASSFRHRDLLQHGYMGIYGSPSDSLLTAQAYYFTAGRIMQTRACRHGSGVHRPLGDVVRRIGEDKLSPGDRHSVAAAKLEGGCKCRLIARIPDGSIHAVIGAVTACVLYR